MTTLEPPDAVAAVGVIWLTVPSSVWPSAVTVTAVDCPTLMLPMALSAKLAVTCIGPTSSTIALPDGARMPATTLTAVTVPSAGAVSVAAATWILAWVTACWALVMDAWSDAIVEAVGRRGLARIRELSGLESQAGRGELVRPSSSTTSRAGA